MKGQIVIFPIVAVIVCIITMIIGLAWYWVVFGLLVVSPIISVVFIVLRNCKKNSASTSTVDTKVFERER